MSRWFRHYAGMMRDEKLVSVAVRSKQPVERVVWVWGAILESASEINDNGRYEFDTGEAAYFLRCDDADLVSILSSLESLGRLSEGVVVRWSDRQYSSDSAAERQRRYRERKSANAAVPQDDRNDKRNGDVTPPSRDAQVTPQDTETETDIQKEEPNGSSKKRGSRLPPDFQPDLDFAVGIGLSRSQAENEAVKFREWWPAQPGQKGVKLEWGLTWQTWCRKALERMPNARGSPPQRPRTVQDAARDLVTRMQNADRPDQSSRPDQPLALGFSADRRFGTG